MVVFVCNMQKYKEKNNNTMLFSHSKPSFFLALFNLRKQKAFVFVLCGKQYLKKKLVDEQPYQCA